MAYATKKHNKKCMAKGGEVEGVHKEDKAVNGGGQSHMGTAVRQGDAERAKRIVYDKIKQQRNSGARAKHELMAEGGEVDESSDMHDADMIARIMHKRKMYSEGGEAANDVGVSEADKDPAEFDDLVLDDNLEDDSGAGNEHGDPEQAERDHDVIAKVLMSRKKKDRMPRPA